MQWVCFNIGTGRESSVLDIFRLLKQYVGKRLPRGSWPCHTRRTTKEVVWTTESKRCAWLGTKVDLEEGLEITAQAFAEETQVKIDCFLIWRRDS